MGMLQGAREWYDWFTARPTERKFYRPLTRDRIFDDPKLEAVDGEAFPAEASYFSVRIVEMHLQNAGEYFRNFLPMVVTLSEFSRGGQARALPFFLNNDRLKEALGTASGGLGLIQMQNVYALRHVPVNADGLSLFCGLFRMAHQDFAAALLDLLAEIGGQLGAAQGVDVAKAVYRQLSKVVGMDGVEFRFGHLDGSCHVHGSGYRIFAGQPARPSDVEDLAMVAGRLQHRDASGSCRPVTEFDYCVIALERLQSRATAGLLTTLPLHQRWVEVIPFLTANRVEDAEAAFGKLQSEILMSADLTEEDRLVALAVYNKKWADVGASIRPRSAQLRSEARSGQTGGRTTGLFKMGLSLETEDRRRQGSEAAAAFGEVLAAELRNSSDQLASERPEIIGQAEIVGVATALRASPKARLSASDAAAMLTAARLRSLAA
jgi:hypothetical protein